MSATPTAVALVSGSGFRRKISIRTSPLSGGSSPAPCAVEAGSVRSVVQVRDDGGGDEFDQGGGVIEASDAEEGHGRVVGAEHGAVGRADGLRRGAVAVDVGGVDVELHEVGGGGAGGGQGGGDVLGGGGEL